MEWLKFGRAMCAIIVTTGVTWTLVSPATPLLAAKMLFGFSVFVSILLGTATIFERLRQGNESVDMTTIIENLENGSGGDEE